MIHPKAKTSFTNFELLSKTGCKTKAIAQKSKDFKEENLFTSSQNNDLDNDCDSMVNTSASINSWAAPVSFASLFPVKSQSVEESDSTLLDNDLSLSSEEHYDEDDMDLSLAYEFAKMAQDKIAKSIVLALFEDSQKDSHVFTLEELKNSAKDVDGNVDDDDSNDDENYHSALEHLSEHHHHLPFQAVLLESALYSV